MWQEVLIGLIVAAPGWALAARERKSRQGAERDHASERRQAERLRAALEAQLDRPELTVDYAGYRREEGGLGRLLIQLELANKGPTVAKDVQFGVRIGAYEGAAGPAGRPKVAAAVSPSETLAW